MCISAYNFFIISDFIKFCDSQLFTLKDSSSTLSTDFSLSIRLYSNYSYGIALLSFHSYIRNTEDGLGNIEDGQESIVRMENGNDKERKVIKISERSYEIEDFETYIRKKINLPETDENKFLHWNRIIIRSSVKVSVNYN